MIARDIIVHFVIEKLPILSAVNCRYCTVMLNCSILFSNLIRKKASIVMTGLKGSVTRFMLLY